MGVYHLMGLGLSVGTVIGPLTYLAHRYQRWNEEDQGFFERSGEARQRQSGKKTGDVQGLVLFTTREVIKGEKKCLPYADNPKGQIAQQPEKPKGPMKETLRPLLTREWPAISGGRQAGVVFWCEVDRRDIRTTYERVARVVAALAGTGGQGKEMWINLTGGNNVINSALQIAAMLSGEVARLYYVQAENEDAEKCVRYTAEHGYWVDLPVMPLALGPITLAILQLLEEISAAVPTNDLHSRLLNSEHWNLVQGMTPGAFQDTYLKPMWKQGLIAEANDGYVVGPQWEVVRPYQEILQQARDNHHSIESLAKENSDWLQKEELTFSGRPVD